jgi:hypothetical protein
MGSSSNKAQTPALDTKGGRNIPLSGASNHIENSTGERFRFLPFHI